MSIQQLFRHRPYEKIPGHNNSLIVTDSASDESFKIALSSDTIRDLQLSKVDIALVKGKRGKETALIVEEDNDAKGGSAKINEVARCNLQVEPGDDILVYPYPQIKCAKRVAVVPIPENDEDITGPVFDKFLAPYFQKAYPPVHDGDIFITHSGGHQVKFKVIQVDPAGFAVVSQDTVIYPHESPSIRKNKTLMKPLPTSVWKVLRNDQPYHRRCRRSQLKCPTLRKARE